MELIPGYRMTAAGSIPDEWFDRNLQELCRCQITYGIVQCGPHINNGVPYIRVSDMDKPNLDVSSMLRTSIEIARKFDRSAVSTDDLVFALRGKIGEVRLVDASVSGANLTQGTARISPNSAVHPKFLLWMMRSRGVLRQANLQAKGSTFVEITLADLRKLKVPLPPTITEQRAIAQALSDVDELINRLDKLIVKKRAIKQATIQQLLTGKTRLPGFSGEWNTRELKMLGSINPESLGAGTSKDYEFKYISLEDVNRGELAGFTVQEFRSAPSRARRKVQSGDILVANVRPNLQSHLLFNENGSDWICSTGFTVLRVDRQIAVADFIFFQLFGATIGKQIDGLITGSNYPAINAGDVGRLEILCPELSEQIAISQILKEMSSEIVALERRRDKSLSLKQGMMQELLTGKTRLI